MKIHIVQKGDTLWEIAKKYGVDFEQLKQLNSQLSSPDMIMPGMKIKVPSPTKAVQKEGQVVKEQLPQAQHPFKNIAPKPLPVIKEDEKEQSIMQPQMPVPPTPQMPMQQPTTQMPMQPMMQMPIMEQEMNYTTINLPPIPNPVPPKEEAVKEIKQMPSPKPMPLPQPLPAQQQMPMVPLCCHVINPYCPPRPEDYFTVMGSYVGGQNKPIPVMNGNPGFPPPYGNMMDMPSPSLEMPVNPAKAGSKDCGCKGKAPYPHHYMGNQMGPPQGFAGVPNQLPNFNPPPMAQAYPTNQFPPNFAGANEGNLYPKPPGFEPPYTNFNFREDTDESKSE